MFSTNPSSPNALLHNYIIVAFGMNRPASNIDAGERGFECNINIELHV